LHTERVSGDDWGVLSLWQVAKDLGLIAMGMSRRGAFDFGLAGASAAVVQLAPEPARPAVIVATLNLDSAANGVALKFDRRASAAALRPGLAFAMNSQAGGS
jgi:hypothetical protein